MLAVYAWPLTACFAVGVQKAKELNKKRALRRFGSRGLRRSAKKLGMSMSSLSVFRKVCSHTASIRPS